MTMSACCGTHTPKTSRASSQPARCASMKSPATAPIRSPLGSQIALTMNRSPTAAAQAFISSRTGLRATPSILSPGSRPPIQCVRAMPSSPEMPGSTIFEPPENPAIRCGAICPRPMTRSHSSTALFTITPPTSMRPASFLYSWLVISNRRADVRAEPCQPFGFGHRPMRAERYKNAYRLDSGRPQLRFQDRDDDVNGRLAGVVVGDDQRRAFALGELLYGRGADRTLDCVEHARARVGDRLERPRLKDAEEVGVRYLDWGEGGLVVWEGYAHRLGLCHDEYYSLPGAVSCARLVG